MEGLEYRVEMLHYKAKIMDENRETNILSKVF